MCGRRKRFLSIYFSACAPAAQWTEQCSTEKSLRATSRRGEERITLHPSSTKNNRIILQPRDKHLLETLSKIRLVDRFQAMEIAPFASASRAKTRLIALVRSGHLDRFFVGTIKGGRRAIYVLPNS